MPAYNSKKIKKIMYSLSESSSLRKGTSVVWEHPTYVSELTMSIQPVPIPTWVVAIRVALIGGGGGGQSGNGTNNAAGRPGGASAWKVFYTKLDRQPGDAYYLNVYVGVGGKAGGNSDHASGGNGTRSIVYLYRKRGSTSTSIEQYVSDGGLAGPASGLGMGATSSRPGVVYTPRITNTSNSTLPRGAAAAMSKTGGSPGAGGGCGGGGYFGARGTGRSGGNGRVHLYFYGVPK